MPRRRQVAALGAFACLAVGSGCSSYVLQGRVVEGLSSEMTLVPTSDPRLEGRLSDPEAQLLVTMAPQDAAGESGQRP